MKRCSTILLLVAICLPAACRMEMGKKADDDTTQKEPSLELVRAQTPERGLLTARLEITARVEALEKADIIPRVEGTVVEVLVDEGADVSKGDLLARIEDDEAQIRVEAQQLAVEQASLAISTAKLAEEEARAALKASDAAFTREQNELDRALKQHARGAISDTDKEAAEFEHKTALADRQQAELKAKRAAEDVLNAELGARTARNSLKAEELKLSFTRLEATLSGRLMKRELRLGQKAVLGQAAFAIADLATLVVRTRIPETDLRVLKTGLKVELEATAFPSVTYTGTVDLISSEIDTDGGQIDVRIKLEPGEPPLRPGMFVSGHIVTEERDGSLLIPKKALLFDRDRPYIYAVEGTPDKPTVKKIYIRRGLQNARAVEYLPLPGEEARVSDATRIVVVGLDRLSDGAEVQIDKTDGSQKEPQAESKSSTASQ